MSLKACESAKKLDNVAEVELDAFVGSGHLAEVELDAFVGSGHPNTTIP
jgi:hypothetical protein